MLFKSGPGFEPLCNREAQVGAPDLDLAILLGLQLRRRTAGEWRCFQKALYRCVGRADLTTHEYCDFLDLDLQLCWFSLPFASVSGLLTQRGPWSGCVGLCFRLKRLLFMLGKRLFGFQNPISKSGPGLEPLCNREAQVGAPDLDLAILSGLQLRRRTAGEWRCFQKAL